MIRSQNLPCPTDGSRRRAVHRTGYSSGFTLIELMVAVMIISVVIASLLQLFSNNTTLFNNVQRQIGSTMQSTLLLGNREIGFEKKSVMLDELVKGFDVDDELRRSLKSQQALITYTEVRTLDFSEMEEAPAGSEEEPQEEIVYEEGEMAQALEIGRTTLRIGDQSNAFLRLKLQ
jgi:prepilin-type N-terminal cleavage/methylation domain-containing protein